MPSSVITAWRYDAPSQVLTITFVSGRVYAYLDVPADVAEGMRLAFAKGEYFNKVVRDRFVGQPVGLGTGTPQRSLL
jgi:hypothetical protein